MPVVHVFMLKGRTREQKRKVIEGVTDVIVREAGAKPEQTTVVISETEREDWGEAGRQLQG